MSWMLCNHASSVNLCTLSLRGMLYLCTCHSVYNSVYASVGQCCVCAGIRFGCLVERSEACDSTFGDEDGCYDRTHQRVRPGSGAVDSVHRAFEPFLDSEWCHGGGAKESSPPHGYGP